MAGGAQLETRRSPESRDLSAFKTTGELNLCPAYSEKSGITPRGSRKDGCRYEMASLWSTTTASAAVEGENLLSQESLVSPAA